MVNNVRTANFLWTKKNTFQSKTSHELFLSIAKKNAQISSCQPNKENNSTLPCLPKKNLTYLSGKSNVNEVNSLIYRISFQQIYHHFKCYYTHEAHLNSLSPSYQHWNHIEYIGYLQLSEYIKKILFINQYDTSSIWLLYSIDKIFVVCVVATRLTLIEKSVQEKIERKKRQIEKTPSDASTTHTHTRLHIINLKQSYRKITKGVCDTKNTWQFRLTFFSIGKKKKRFFL